MKQVFKVVRESEEDTKMTPIGIASFLNAQSCSSVKYTATEEQEIDFDAQCTKEIIKDDIQVNK